MNKYLESVIENVRTKHAKRTGICPDRRRSLELPGPRR